MSAREDLIYEKIIAADKKAGVPVTPEDDVWYFPTKHDATIAKHFLAEGRNGPLIKMIARREATPLKAIVLLRRAFAEDSPQHLDRLRKLGPDD